MTAAGKADRRRRPIAGCAPVEAASHSTRQTRASSGLGEARSPPARLHRLGRASRAAGMSTAPAGSDQSRGHRHEPIHRAHRGLAHASTPRNGQAVRVDALGRPNPGRRGVVPIAHGRVRRGLVRRSSQNKQRMGLGKRPGGCQRAAASSRTRTPPFVASPGVKLEAGPHASRPRASRSQRAAGRFVGWARSSPSTR